MDNILITLDGIAATIFNKMREHKVYIDPTKSLDSRMNFVVSAMIKFIKSQPVLAISFVAAVVTMFIVPPLLSWMPDAQALFGRPQ